MSSHSSSSAFVSHQDQVNPLDILAAERLQQIRKPAAYPPDGQTINPEAERAVIAALMRNPDGKEMIRLGIGADLFALDATREAFRAIAALIADGTVPDAATLSGAVSPATKIEIETSLQEHASAANLPTYVALLKGCRQERQVQAARDRLIKAAQSGSPDHELQAILESIRQATQGDAVSKSRFANIGELFALPPTENWLIKRYVTTDSLNVAFGDPGCGKSFIAIDLACHVATGRPWRGCAVKQGPVLYIAGEGRNGLSKRFKAWFERHGEKPRNIQLSTTPIRLVDAGDIAALAAEIKAMPEAPVLIVIDTLNRNFGPGDENSTADMTKAVAGLDALRTATGAAILAIHHTGHGDKSRARGSIVLNASADAEFSITKSDRYIQLANTKSKDNDIAPPLAWSLEKQALPWADEDGTPIDSAILEPTAQTEQAAQDRTKSRFSGKTAIALNALRTALMLHGVENNGIVTVSEDQWRKVSYKSGISSGDSTQNARRMAFNRAREILISAKAVACDDGRYWIPTPRTPRTDPDKPDICPAMSGPDAEIVVTRTDRTHPHKAAQCADMCGLDNSQPDRTHPHRTAHTPIRGVRLCGCADGEDVPNREQQQSTVVNTVDAKAQLTPLVSDDEGII